jgi:hypothetical protein
MAENHKSLAWDLVDYRIFGKESCCVIYIAKYCHILFGTHGGVRGWNGK